jgi:hypothetical protein
VRLQYDDKDRGLIWFDEAAQFLIFLGFLIVFSFFFFYKKYLVILGNGK